MPKDMLDTDNAGATAEARVTIPKNTPEAGKPPKYSLKRPNYADNEETANLVTQWVSRYNDDFEAQAAWDSFEKEMDVADEMFRAAVNRTQLESDESANAKATGSNIKSATYYSELRAITAGESSIMLDKDNSLPVVYEPIPDSSEYSIELGAELAKERNAVLSYTMDKAKMRDDIRKCLWTVNKYGNAPIEMQWDRRKEERTVKEPIAYEEIDLGDDKKIHKPSKFKTTKKTVTVADNPRFIVHDMRNVKFDAMIDNMQDQSCIIIRTQKQLSDLWAEQKAGRLLNLDKVTKDHLYMGEGENSTLDERQSNAGEGGDAEKPNSLFDVYYGWVRVPVDDESGDWDAENQICHWYEYVLIGSLENGKTVCARLSPLPYSCNQIPFDVVHALEDDKGALHMGYSTIVKSLIMQEMTALDQATDNITVRNRKPWIVEKGSINIRDMVFSPAGNRVWWKKPGAQDPHEIEVQDTTQFTLNYLSYIEEVRRKLLGTNKPMMGEALGGRTSSAEAQSVYDQALKPALEDAKYKSNQIFKFIAYWVSEMWKDFGDPELTINLTGNSMVRQIKPAGIYGDMRIRVQAIKQFQDSIMRRKEQDALMNQFLPLLVQSGVIDAEGLSVFAKQVMADRNIDEVDAIVKASSNYDAIHVAKAENVSIVWNGVYDMPKEGENHAVHNREHKPYLASVMLLPENERPPIQNLNMLKMHIQLTEQMEKGGMTMTGQGGPTPPSQQPAPQEAPPRGIGEEFGDMAGAMENPPGTFTA